MSIVNPLSALATAAQSDGWSSAPGRIERVPLQARLMGWTVVPSRTDGPEVDRLTPKTREAAPRQSLSARYGRGRQPLHTDGAHHAHPPDLIVLSVEAASEVPTLLWRFREIYPPSPLSSDLRHGLFTVRSGSEAFLAPAWVGDHLRFDPGCMTPSDARSRRVVEFFAGKHNVAFSHQWKEPGLLLVIDNRRVLHSRGAADNEPGRAMRRVSIRIRRGAR